MEHQKLSLTWQGIPFTLSFIPDYFASAGIAHIEIRCDEALPITETGYKSIFAPNEDIADIRIAAALIKAEMDRIAERTGWQREQQMSLF